MATSHANASTRCQPWQGKIYILDAEVGSVQIRDNHYDGDPKPIGKTPDGKDYYSLKEAMTHGFLGYNCRHRLILYKPGMIMPKEYTANQVSKERSIETTARSLERQIRVAKKKTMLANNSLDRKKYQEESKKLQDTYWNYCKEHDYPVAEWRTRVSLNEREGIKNGGISSEINSNNKGITYEQMKLSNLSSDKAVEYKLNKIKSKISEYENYGILETDFSKSLPNIKKIDRTIVLTKERKKHILDRHPEVEKYINDLISYVNSPDKVSIDNKKADTINVKKYISSSQYLFITIRLVNENNELSNSIISARIQTEKK